MRRATRRGMVISLVVAVLPGAATSCIDVGHPAEVGCFADPNEPGCPGAMIAGDAAAEAAKQSRPVPDAGAPDSGPDGGGNSLDSGPDGGGDFPDSSPDGGGNSPDSSPDGAGDFPDSGPDGGGD